MDILTRIKSLAIRGQVRFTIKADQEMRWDDLGAAQVIESILNASSISKTLKSRSRFRARSGERLYVIKSFSDDGTFIYTKGAIRREEEWEVYYLFISAKINTD